MKIQKTFEGNYSQSSVISFIQDLSKCFIIKRAVIRKMKQKHNWRGDKYQIEIRYE